MQDLRKSEFCTHVIFSHSTPSNGAPDILGELWLDAMCDGGKKDVKVEIIMQI